MTYENDWLEEEHASHLPTPEVDQTLLAEVVLSSLKMNEAFQTTNELLPTMTQYQLAVASSQFRSPELDLPSSLYGVIDAADLRSMIVTYIFDSPAERPYLEVRLETDDETVLSLSRTGRDQENPYNASLVVNGHDYTNVPVPAEQVAELLDQVVIPSLNGDVLGDPQSPPEARSLIDTLTRSQQADLVESRVYDFTVPDHTSKKPVHFKVRLHKINDQPNEIEIETVTEDSIGFDPESKDIIESYQSLLAVLSFDDFSQSVKFYSVTDEVKDLPSDGAHIHHLQQDIDTITAHVHRSIDEVYGQNDL